MKQTIFLLLFLLIIVLPCTKTFAQSPAAAPAKAPAAHVKPPAAPTAKAPTAASTKPPPTPPADSAQSPVMVPVQTSKGPINVVKILQKAGHFTFFIRLIRTTQEDIQFASQLNNSRDGLTIFAPTDGAFSNIIKAGTLNSLNDQEKIELVQFHVLPKFLSTAQFQTLSNPLKTLAGAGRRFQFNVTTTQNLVNVSTGLTDTSVSGIVYTDNQVAIYQVDKVLLPIDIFAPKPPAPAPVPPPKHEREESPESPVVPNPKDVISGALSSFANGNVAVFVVGIIIAAILSL